ncbi:Ig-like domain-containing protein [Flammeovirga pacifica]|nr:Ig-like domain-containing protein [Flammeovirga pacifica]
MNYFTKCKKHLALLALLACTYTVEAQDVDVDVNLNIVHSVDGVSDFGRERHMIIHSTPTDADWIGEEDKREYLINDLDVYFGRDNGSATWKFNNTPEDPNRANKPDLDWMVGEADRLKRLYDKEYLAHQWEYKGPMIMGTNPHSTYPTLSWHDDGITWTGWQPKDVETSAEWVVQYLDNYFKDNPGQSGEPMPTYWEVVNEIDMLMMTGHMCWTNLDDVWKYHNLVAEKVKEKLGARAPKVGGLTWGMHDFHMLDWTSRYSAELAISWGVPAEAVTDQYAQYRQNDWYQWDVMWQGFIDHCGDNMDYYAVHIYDWPSWETPSSHLRRGGHTEAMFDILEWYDNHKFGKRKDIVLSEYGAVSGHYIHNMPDADPHRRDWENLKPFNSMLMQFLERPSHIILSMPFTPTKAHWGDHVNANGDITSRYPYKMLDDLDGDGDYEWTGFIRFFELWSDVKGTRVDTKSDNKDVQVDAYVDGNKMYLILNNLLGTQTAVNLNFFDDYAAKVTEVNTKHLFLDLGQGAFGVPTITRETLGTAPGKVVLDGDATMVLEYVFDNALVLDQTNKEYKFMGEKLGTGSTPTGGDKIHKGIGDGVLTANVNNVTVPSGAFEAQIRISGDFFSSHVGVPEITINGNVVNYDGNVRGDTENEGHNKWLGVLEIPFPAEYLQASNVITCKANNQVEYATVQIQVWDYSKAPGRGATDAVAVQGISIDGTQELMYGKTVGLTADFSPANATNKNLTWTSSDTDVIKVSDLGVIEAVATNGSATITATSEDGSHVATHSIAAIPFSATPVSSISIVEGASMNVDFYVTTPVTLTILPEDATNQDVVWSSSNEEAVTVDASTGKVNGIAIGESAVITATINDNGTVYTASTTVNVGIVGEETIYCESLPQEVTGNTTYNFDVNVNLIGARDVVVELLSGSTVLGTGTTSADVKGKETVSVEVNLNSVPSVGQYTLRATALNGGQVVTQCTSSLNMLDQIRPSSIAITDWLREVEIGQTLPVTAEVLPENAYNKTVLWTSSNQGVASVNAEGTVTGLALGSTVIRGTTQDGGLVAEVTVQVKSQVVVQPTTITIPSDITVFPNGQLQINPVFDPVWTTETDINWSSSNSLVTVDNNGLITAGGATGTFTLTATSASSASVVATSAGNVGTTLSIEAEAFTGMGGPTGEIAIYELASASKGKAINNVQSGDYVEYQVYVPKAGEYRVSFYAGTGETDGVIEMYVNGESKGTKQVPKNEWDAFAPVTLESNVILPEGNVTIGVVAAGSSQWNWNLDYFQLAFQGEIVCDALTGVQINASNTTVTQGDDVTFVAQLLPTSACPENVTWSSSNTNIATVDNNGKVTGVGVGTATITAQALSFTATQDVIVEGIPDVPVTGVSLNLTEVQLSENGTAQLIASVQPANATNKSVVWSTSDASIATVDNNGLVTAVREGDAVITVTSVVGTYTASTNVNVSTQVISVTGVTVNTTSVNLITGGTSALVATVLPNNASNKAVVWSSNNAAVATVDNNGVVVAVGVGSTDVIVTTVDGSFTATTSVTVTSGNNGGGSGDPHTIEAETFVTTGGTFNDGFVPLGVNKVDGIGINWVNSGDYVEYNVNLTGTFNIDYFISTPENNTAIEMLVDGVSVGTDNVNNNGSWDNYAALRSLHQVTLSGSHTVRIQAVGSNNWQWNLDKVVLTPVDNGGPVIVDVTGVNLDASTINLDPDYTTQLTATVLPLDATDQAVTWSTSDASVATVTDGLVYAVASGTATITVTTNDGGFQASASVTVNTIDEGGYAQLVIEAEDFESTTGTFNDGFVPLGVNKVDGIGINWVNSGDESEYTINVTTAGTYDIEYMVSTPENNAQIQVQIDGVTVSTDDVPNNGQWDAYTALTGSGTATLSVGTHTVKFVATGSNNWQWNLDKVTLTTGSSSMRTLAAEVAQPKMNIYPNPSSEVVNLTGLSNGTYVVALYNINGQEIFNTKIDFRYTHQFNVSSLNTGIYLLRVVGEGVDLKERISVKK